MTRKDIAKKYIAWLREGAIEKIAGLFAEKSMVYSPIYGAKHPGEFYKTLLEDTNSSELTIHGIFEDNDSGKLALYFNYKWTLKNNKTVRFDAVDIISFNTQNEIVALHIIYDTVSARKLIGEMKN